MKEKAAAESDEVITINFMAPYKRMCTSLKFTSKITAPHLHAEASCRSGMSQSLNPAERYLELRGTAYYHEKLANIAITIHVDV